jgi:sulfatase modifying factor 1
MQPAEITSRPDENRTADMVWIEGGTFRMGSNDHYPEEAPVDAPSAQNREN